MKEAFITILGKPEGIILFQLVEATQFTIYLSLIAFLGGGIVGGIITLMRIMPSKAAKRFAVSYIWLFQSTPLLMMLFLTGLGVPRLLDIDVNPWTAAVVSLIIYSSAYLSDVWRGAVESIPEGQWEGAEALGLRFVPTLRLVIIPQAVRIALAPTVGFMVQIIKGTSLAYIIGFHDLMAIGKRWANAPVDGSEPFIIFPIMALIYFVLCYPLTLWSRHLEKRLGTVKDEKAPLPVAA
ncbi:amino acid ABC transporter permease [Maritimibacter sp. UBA3975]|uniref:amino acid ABC transporter permease n=1 Tax=Maritimibacter sp. UBA3975 TaxID=1946833 RepID=UPI000C0B3E45|nr:amino acid ABC transporter permease [Maritimibacter sp. UBA3975]MAM62499.1 amino acid ABC transporter permease [Maritimibacter sp.]